MRLTALLLSAALSLFTSVALAGPPDGPAPSPEGEPAASGDLLGEVVVEARASTLHLTRIGVEGPDQRSGFDAQLGQLLTRDLDLSGQFKLVKDGPAATFESPFDSAPWRERKVEAVVRSEASVLESGQIQLRVALYLPELGDDPAALESVEVSPTAFRRAGHQLVDRVIAHITGYEGPFDSRLLVVAREGKERRLYSADADGMEVRLVSPRDHTVVAATIGPGGVPYWVGGPRGKAYALYRAGDPDPIAVEPSGSIYGVAYDPRRDEWAMSVARGSRIVLYVGQLGSKLEPVSGSAEFALAPSYGPDGTLYWSETGERATRVRTAKRRLSPTDVSATRPTVCRGPGGDWLLMQVNRATHARVARVRPDGSGFEPIGSGTGKTSSPACSPDGRLVAFSSQAKGGSGPGVYLGRADGRRPKKLMDLRAEEIYWTRRPAG